MIGHRIMKKMMDGLFIATKPPAIVNRRHNTSMLWAQYKTVAAGGREGVAVECYETKS